MRQFYAVAAGPAPIEAMDQADEEVEIVGGDR